MKFSNVITLLISLTIYECLDKEYKKLDIEFGEYSLYYKNHECRTEMVYTEIIYEDDEDVYYYYRGCGVIYHILFKGQYISIFEAIQDNVLSIDDILASNWSKIQVSPRDRFHIQN